MELLNPSTRLQRADSSNALTRALLGAGALIAPFFYIVAIAQIFVRPGFDIRRLAISALTLGELGWIQSANFEITGLLLISSGVGLRRALRGRRGGTWVPILLGAAGLGTILAGFFHPDPALGFPPGAPAGVPSTMTAPATVHQLASMLTFGCTIAACFVMAHKFAREGRRGWMIYCLASGIVAPILLVLAMTDRDWVGVLLASMVAVAFGCVSVVAGFLLVETYNVEMP